MSGTLRKVTEADFRQPEFRDALPEDYEFRPDGKLVRKDRWENAVRTIGGLVGVNGREFEVPDVIAAVQALVQTLEPGQAGEDSEEVGPLTRWAALVSLDGDRLVHAGPQAVRWHKRLQAILTQALPPPPAP